MSVRRSSRCGSRLGNCSPLCGHRQFVEAYQAQRAMEEAMLEQVTNMLPGDVERYLIENGPLINFRQWLEDNRRRGVAYYPDGE